MICKETTTAKPVENSEINNQLLLNQTHIYRLLENLFTSETAVEARKIVIVGIIGLFDFSIIIPCMWTVLFVYIYKLAS